MRRIALGLRDETYEQIDAARGKIPRERFIRNLITTALGDSQQAAQEALPPKSPPPLPPTALPKLNSSNEHDHVWVGNMGNTHCKVCGVDF